MRRHKPYLTCLLLCLCTLTMNGCVLGHEIMIRNQNTVSVTVYGVHNKAWPDRPGAKSYLTVLPSSDLNGEAVFPGTYHDYSVVVGGSYMLQYRLTRLDWKRMGWVLVIPKVSEVPAQ